LNLNAKLINHFFWS